MELRSRIGRVALGGALLIAPLATGALAQTNGPVVRLTLQGVVDPFVADYLEREIDAAGDAPAILLTIDTPGGLGSAMDRIVQAILASDVPVICFVAPEGARAASAGAFILMACHVAAMAPATNVGASTPVGISGVTLSRKVEQDAAASIRKLAERRGRNVELAETFVTKSRSITAEEALDGGVIDLIADSERSLLEAADGRRITLAGGDEVAIDTAGAAVEDHPMGAGIGFLHALFDPNLAFIFFWLGLALIVLELIVPGHVFSGTVGTILLILSIVSFGLLPVRVVGIALLIASIVFFVLELKVPGLGLWSFAGIAALILGGLFLFDPAGGVRVSPFVIVPVAGAMALFFGYVVSKALAMRHLPPAQGAEAIVGRDGVVLGAGLDPEGVVRVAAEEWKATTDSGPIAGGTRIRVTRLDGLVLTVEPLTSEHAQIGGATPTRGGPS